MPAAGGAVWNIEVDQVRETAARANHLVDFYPGSAALFLKVIGIRIPTRQVGQRPLIKSIKLINVQLGVRCVPQDVKLDSIIHAEVNGAVSIIIPIVITKTYRAQHWLAAAHAVIERGVDVDRTAAVSGRIGFSAVPSERAAAIRAVKVR